MKKVFIIHGLEGTPNGGWRPWLMSELQKIDVYACALSMPKHGAPVLSEWIEEIERHVERNQEDELFLVGHSLGVPTILKYLETMKEGIHIKGAVLVSGPAEKTTNEKVTHFLNTPINFDVINTKVSRFAIIHGDDDPVVPIQNAGFLAEKLHCDLVVIHEGKHLNGSAGFTKLPECLTELTKMFT
ncbi:MAG: serine hydrolase family protein [Candidatus Pacebacteria bacterium]|nr:serine hydrolase family protein [Candidatus Paceibacterota bacterium]MBP9866713.1 serine hydrolase family protein [Candidatus Paceibacterota bacterium]